MASFGNVTGQQIPANQKLWDLLVLRAKHRFRTYPSPAASHWVHEEYLREGGRFVKSHKEMSRKDREQLNKKRRDLAQKKAGKKMNPSKEKKD